MTGAAEGGRAARAEAELREFGAKKTAIPLGAGGRHSDRAEVLQFV